MIRAVVVSFDHLPVGFLGLHGNTWIDTPHFDRLAAEGVVFDRHFAECIGPAASHAWWTGCLQFPANDGEVRGREFAERLRDEGVRSVLLVEEPNPRPVALPRSFDEVESVTGEDGLDVAHGGTPFAKLVDRAIERLQSPADGGELLWLKSRGVPVPWLPPRALAERFVALFEELDDEEDVEPRPSDDDVEWVALEDLEDEEEEAEEAGEQEEPEDDEADWDEDAAADDEEIDEQAEFEEMLRALASVGGMTNTEGLDESDWLLVRAVYGGYVALLDESLGRLRAALGDDVLLIVTAAEGESLGERVGFETTPGRLGEEHVHVPLLVGGPGLQPGSRVAAFTQPIDLVPTLFDWFGLGDADRGCEGDSLLGLCRGEADAAGREIVVSGTAGNVDERLLGVRTPDEYVVCTREGPPGEREARLYEKPEDVWEIHDTSDQRPDETHRLIEAIDQIVKATSAECPVTISLPSADLSDGSR